MVLWMGECVDELKMGWRKLGERWDNDGRGFCGKRANLWQREPGPCPGSKF